MFSRYAFFNLGALFVLWGLSIAGVIAGLAVWTATEPEYDEGVRSSGGRCLARARISMTAGFVAVWICTFLGETLSGSKDLPGLPFGFWQDHPVLLQRLMLPIDAAFAAAVMLAFNARGRGVWIVRVAASLMAIASFLGSVLLWTP